MTALILNENLLHTSPLSSSTSRSTPWAAGCCGPKFNVILVIPFSGTNSEWQSKKQIKEMIKSTQQLFSIDWLVREPLLGPWFRKCSLSYCFLNHHPLFIPLFLRNTPSPHFPTFTNFCLQFLGKDNLVKLSIKCISYIYIFIKIRY